MIFPVINFNTIIILWLIINKNNNHLPQYTHISFVVIIINLVKCIFLMLRNYFMLMHIDIVS